MRPLVVTLCGSTKFKEIFEKANHELTLKGIIVLTVGAFGHADNLILTESQKHSLDNLHLEKIKMSDAILVLNYKGYIGESTRREMGFADKVNVDTFLIEDYTHLTGIIVWADLITALENYHVQIPR